MKYIPLQFKFKGDRTYIHGTDMYETMMGQVIAEHRPESIERVRWVVHQSALKQCHMHLGAPNESLAKPENAIAHLMVNSSAGQIAAWLYEIDETVINRYAYDEDRTKALCTFGENEISIQTDSGYSSIETAVAMTKFLHQHLFPADIGKWWFTRLDLARPFSTTDTSQFVIKFIEDLGNGKLTKSMILSGPEQLGYIYFAARKL